MHGAVFQHHSERLFLWQYYEGERRQSWKPVLQVSQSTEAMEMEMPSGVSISLDSFFLKHSGLKTITLV